LTLRNFTEHIIIQIMMFSKEGFEEMYKIVVSFISRPESNAFRDPVDWKHLGLLDYPSIVKHPMDLGVMHYH